MNPTEKIKVIGSDLEFLWKQADEGIERLKLILATEKLSPDSREALLLTIGGLQSAVPVKGLHILVDTTLGRSGKQAEYQRNFRAKLRHRSAVDELILAEAGSGQSEFAKKNQEAEIGLKIEWYNLGGNVDIFLANSAKIREALKAGAKLKSLVKEYSATPEGLF